MWSPGILATGLGGRVAGVFLRPGAPAVGPMHKMPDSSIFFGIIPTKIEESFRFACRKGALQKLCKIVLKTQTV